MSQDLSKITTPIPVVEEVITKVPQPTIPEEAPEPAPKIKRPPFKAHTYDNVRGGMTGESGRFKVR